MKAALILPPREMFSPDGSGAVGLLLKLLAGPDDIVYGMPTTNPFDTAAFRPVAPKLRLAPVAMRYAAGLAAALRANPPDIIEVHNRPDIALFLTQRFPRIPTSLFLHNDPHGMRGAQTPADRTNLLQRLAMITPVSAYLRDRLLEGIANPPSVRVFPNFVDLDAMPKPRPEQLILFAGRIVADKGADSFVAACSLALPTLSGWRAEMIGADRFGANSPETPFLRALRPQAAKAGVIMTGWKPHAEVLQAMARAAIVVVPSRWPEPFGLTALEAMACGSALLCSPRGGLSEVMGKAAVPINPDAPRDIAAKLQALAGDDELRAEIAEAGLVQANRFGLPAARARLAGLREAALTHWSQRQPHPI
jgi:glycosyltransferase involved in cell wall biosynthesis